MSFMKFPITKRCKRLKPSEYCKSRRRKRSSRRSSKSRKSSCRSRRSSRASKKRCARPGRVTKNPFFNFLRQFRKQHCGWSITKVAIEGAKAWCSMDMKSKEKYYKEACGQMGGRGGRRGRSRSRRRRSKSGRGKFRSCLCGNKRGKSRSSRGRKRGKSSRGRNSKCL